MENRTDYEITSMFRQLGLKTAAQALGVDEQALKARLESMGVCVTCQG